LKQSRPAWRKRPSFAAARRQRRLLRRHAANHSDVVFDHDWRAIPYTRAALVNRLLAARPDGRYLEIGCAGDELFDAVMAADKVGVDPVRGGTHRMTSDAYFAAEPEARFDVIFIDGLHLYDQVRRDLVNALARVNPGGWIALHDSFPRDWLEEHVPQIVTSGWTGDGWKVAFELLDTEGVDFRLVAIDHGVLVVKPLRAGIELADRQRELGPARFAYFAEGFARLPVTDYAGACGWIGSIRTPDG
jgi:hypothetical protein